MLSIEITAQPSIELVSLAEAKAHVQVEGTDDDAYISALIVAARSIVESMSGHLIGQHTIVERFPSFTPDGTSEFTSRIPLHHAPVVSLDQVTYYDESNTLQTLSTDIYQIDVHRTQPEFHLKESQTTPGTYERDDAVIMEYTAGHTADTLPLALKHAILLQVADLYEHRETLVPGVMVTPTKQVERLCWLKRNFKYWGRFDGKQSRTGW